MENALMPTAVSSISAEKLLKQLAEVWVSLGKESNDKTSTGILRACALNLLVCVEDDVEVGETIAQLMHEYPSRVIVLRVKPKAEISGRALAQCWMPFGRREQICCEQIEIVTPPEMLAEVDPVIRGVFSGDMPIVFWCRSDDLLQNWAFRDQLLPMAQKLIVDSRRSADPEALLRDLQRLTYAKRRVADLSWTRITRWRETIAQLFDNPSLRASAAAIQEVEITHTCPQVPPSARYLAGWVEGCLSRTLRKSMRSQPIENCDWQIHQLTLRGAEFAATITRRDAMTVEVRWNNQTLALAFPMLTEHGLLLEELSILGLDPSFDRTLNRL
jgi:glucose-6-phosphate dehydrogenase assembly protein OpcA